MKKILSVFSAAIIVFTACSKDDDNPAGIVGTWTTNQVIATSYLNSTLIGSDTTTTGILIFGSDGTATGIDDGDTSTGTYTYNASAKLLTLISDGDSTTATVTSLTNSNLHFTSDETSESGGVSFRFTLDADYRR